jgi:hypothetical protein
MSTIAIRVSDDEHKLFMALAERERMPLSIYVRRMLYAEAERVGLIGTQPTATQPTTLQPPLKDNVLNNEQLLKRLESGEQLTTIAQTSNITVSELQTRIAKAKKARTDGSLAANEAAVDFMQRNPAPTPEHRLTRTSRADGAGFDFAWIRMESPRPCAHSSSTGAQNQRRHD